MNVLPNDVGIWMLEMRTDTSLDFVAKVCGALALLYLFVSALNRNRNS